MNDYAAPLLAMQRMLKDYENLLIARQWQEAIALTPELMTQMRLLTNTVRIQAEDSRL